MFHQSDSLSTNFAEHGLEASERKPVKRIGRTDDLWERGKEIERV